VSIIIKRYDDKSILFAAAVDDFLCLFKKTLTHKKYFDVALSGGQTAKEFFAILRNKIHDLPHLSHLRFFFSDERASVFDSADSNAGNAWRILSSTSVKRSQFFPMFDDINSPAICARNYESLLQRELSLNACNIPIFDLIYLGIGSDGHTASLFPNSKLINNHMTNKKLVDTEKIDHIPFERITLMPRIIQAAQQIHVIAVGQEKAAIIDQILNGALDPTELPAQLILRLTADDSRVVLFSDASGGNH
jgi:6-phosphogluconolactonase